ncbi:MAG: DUF3684 domain-containing protein [Cyanobium sp. 49614_E6]|nr:DUF3684 domain-containing protein [Cyanobium sp. 49614_E6]
MIHSTIHTTEVSAQPVLNDASGVRDQIRNLRDQLDGLIKEITWNDCLGDCCQELVRARLHLLAARDASHRWEGIEHPHHSSNTQILS